MKSSEELSEASGSATLETRLREYSRSIQRYLAMVLPNWRRLLVFNAVVALVSAGLLLLFPGREYTSVVAVLPDYGNKLSSLTGLAAMGGISEVASLAGLDVGGQTPTSIYEDLVRSESVLIPVIEGKYATQKFNRLVNLIEYWELPTAGWIPDSLQERYKLLRALKALNKRMRTDIDRDTKILTIQLNMSESQLAAEVLNNIVESLDTYVRTKRKSYASYQRIYIERRSQQVQDTLRLSEQVLTRFRLQNRYIEASPQLVMEQARLQRVVVIQEAVFIELKKQLELAKIEEIRDTPVINIKELSQNPVIPSSMSLRARFVVILFFSSVISICYYVFKSQIATIWTEIKRLVISSIRPPSVE